MQTATNPTEELAYEAYQARQLHEISEDGLRARAPRLGIGGRAEWDGSQWKPLPYPGFAMQAMVEASQDCHVLSIELQETQQRLMNLVERPGVLYPLPAASFHQTVVNTFSADRLERHIIAPGLLDSFPQRIADSLNDWDAPEGEAPPTMRLIGLSLFRTAIGLLGVFDKKSDFERILSFRDFAYSHPDLTSIGLARTRPFIGHVTLAYLESTLTPHEADALVEGIVRINHDLRQQRIDMQMPWAELRRYDNLSDFIPHPSYPKAKL